MSYKQTKLVISLQEKNTLITGYLVLHSESLGNFSETTLHVEGIILLSGKTSDQHLCDAFKKKVLKS